MNENLNLRVDRRHRGTHSTACKCPDPEYIRPAHYRTLGGEHGRALRNLQYRDKSTGQILLRKRVSADPIFTFLRPVCGRKRAFRDVTNKLMDALFVLTINKVDVATSIITINLSEIARELSPHDESGNVIHEKAVTTSRISRMVDLLILFGIFEAPETPSDWDKINGCRFPKHVILSEQGWQLTGVDMDKLRTEMTLRQEAMAAGILAPGEDVSLRTLRRRWYENMRLKTLHSRRSRSVQEKLKSKLAELPFDERKRQVSERLFRSLKGDVLHLSATQFDKMVWKQLYQMELVNLEQPPPRQTH